MYADSNLVSKFGLLLAEAVFVLQKRRFVVFLCDLAGGKVLWGRILKKNCLSILLVILPGTHFVRTNGLLFVVFVCHLAGVNCCKNRRFVVIVCDPVRDIFL